MTRVSVLCSNLGTNCVMRATLLVELLRQDFEVRLVGFDQGSGLWAPARELHLSVQAIPISNALQLGWHALRGDPFRETDALVISKPLPTSLWPGWFAWRRGIPAVLDIDDWEVGLFPGLAGRGIAHAIAELTHETWTAIAPGHLNARLTTRACEIVARRVTWPKLVSSRWLQARYGGDLLYHVRQPGLDAGRPARHADLEVGDRPWVGFVGTVRPHKGVDVLIEALSRLAGPSAPGLLLAGADPESQHARTVLAKAREILGPARVHHLIPFPASELAGVLAACDVVSVPSRAGTAARGQIPAKLFDAMAAGCAIVASAVNDVPEILAGCGRLVPPDDPAALAGAIAELLADPALRATLAAAARRRQAEHYSHAAGRAVAVSAVRRALATDEGSARRLGGDSHGRT